LHGIRSSEVFYSFRRKAVIYRRIIRSQELTKMFCESALKTCDGRNLVRTDERSLARLALKLDG